MAVLKFLSYSRLQRALPHRQGIPDDRQFSTGAIKDRPPSDEWLKNYFYT
jgi:hypothetical protein